MLVHRKKRPRYGIQMPLTALIDIVFMLLIYFLLTTNFMVEEGISIKLPQANAAKPVVKQEITLQIDREGRIFLGKETIELDAIFSRLKSLIGADTERLVIVKADRELVLNKAVRVMDIAKAAGAGRLCLATEKDWQK